MTNSKKQLNNANLKNNRVCKYNVKMCAIGALALGSVLIPEIALAAAKYDLDAGVKAAMGPPIDALKAHWGKGILISGVSTAVVGGGDGRERATRGFWGSVAGGAVILGLLAALA